MLRGCSGQVCGWTHDIPNAKPSKKDGEVRFWTKLPTAVYVQFKTQRKWRVKGERLHPPSGAVRSVWHLDHRRKYPKLKVSLRQPPLCPYFAITARCATCLAERDLKRTAARAKVRLARTQAKRMKKTLAEVWRLVGEMRKAPRNGARTCKKDFTG